MADHVTTMLKCIQSYVAKGAISQPTLLAIFRATEDKILGEAGCKPSRAARNRIRAIILEVVS